MDYVKSGWSGTHVVCPKCGGYNDRYKWHSCRKMPNINHLHVKCPRCSYEWKKMLTYNRIGVVGSREFKNYEQLQHEVLSRRQEEDWFVSGGALGADSMAQRLAKEKGGTILIHYPKWRNEQGIYIPSAGFDRNRKIVEHSDVVLAFYQKGRFRQGGTANTAKWARDLGVELIEFEEE